MLDLKNVDYEKPTVAKHSVGLMNKFGGAGYSVPYEKISGVPVRELVERFGSPLWVVSEDNLRERFRDLYRAFSTRYPKVAIGYSYKTNFLSGICALFHQEGAWAEVVSGFEYDMAANLGVPGDRIIFNGPYKTKPELRRAIQQGSLINIDSYQEIDDLEELARQLDVEVKVGIRVNMQLYEGDWDRFGFNIESGQAMDACKRISSSDKLRLTGLHAHIGTFITDTNVYRTMANKLASFCMLIRDQPRVSLEYLDVGGGYATRNTLHNAWVPGQYSCPTFDEYADAISVPLTTGLSRMENTPLLILEPGRALVDEGVHLLTTVVSQKILSQGRKGIVVDAGVNLLPTSYWYRFGIHVAERSLDISDGGTVETVNIYGPLCMNIDCIQFGAYLPPVRAGDILVVTNVGAYNFSQSMQFIRPRPAAVMISKGGAEYLRLPETTEYICQLDRIPGHLVKHKSS